jgi:isochorismate pyruvate lyase
MPADCRTMAEVRSGVDRLDANIISLLAERFRFMEAAARIKQDRSTVRDEARKAQVLRNARRLARKAGAPEVVIHDLYERLVEASIRFELDCFEARISGA